MSHRSALLGTVLVIGALGIGAVAAATASVPATAAKKHHKRHKKHAVAPPKSTAPTTVTVEIMANGLGAKRTLTIKSGALTCTGDGYPEGTSCFVNIPTGSTFFLYSRLDEPLPAGWSWELDWPDDGTKVKNCTVGAVDCESSSLTETQTGGIFVMKIHTPNGTAGAAMTTQPCTQGQPENGHDCPS